MIAVQNHFNNRHELAAGLATAVAAALSRSISEKGQAVLAVSGGSTPALFFSSLSRTSISWEKTIVTLADERQVEDDSHRSNARLVRHTLLRNRAAQARFVPLAGNTAEAARLHLDTVVLGMGEDGHTASLFPGGDNLGRALALNSDCAIYTMEAPGAGEARLTYALPKLIAASRLFLHIEGKKKWQVLEAAMAGRDELAMPIRAFLHSPSPMHLYWCP